MAIIDASPGVEVEMIVDDLPLKEYEDSEIDEEDERTTTRFVEAMSSQVFGIRCKLLPNFKYEGNGVGFSLSADGTFVDGRFIMKDSLQTVISKGYQAGQGDVRKYRFAELETASDGHIKNSEVGKAKDLGSIRVAVFHYNFSCVRKAIASGGNSRKEVDSVGIVSEKALKGRSITHSIDFVKSTPSAQSTPKSPETRTSGIVVKNDPVPGFVDAIATFVFCYRSYAALKSMLIIPRTPTPPPLEARDPDSLSREDILELQKRLKAAADNVESKVKIKRELADGDATSRKRTRPNAGDPQLEIDEEGNFRETVVTTAEGTQQVVIELD